MASGALPPGFPPIEIDGEPYWDGGIVSNTPLQQVLEHSGPRENMCIFQIDLFSARGCLPDNLFEVPQREKEIRYSGRTRLNTDIFCKLQAIRRAIRHLRGKLPPEFDDNPHWQLLDRLSCDAAVTIVQLIHRRAAYWTESNDYDFSRYSIEEHWQAGRADVMRTLNHPARTANHRRRACACSTSRARSIPTRKSARCKAPQLTRDTSTRLSEKVGARPSPQCASDEIEFTDPSERLRLRQ
jgi:NTE family protein